MIITEEMGPSGAGIKGVPKCPDCGLELAEMDYWYYCCGCEKDFDIGQI